MQGGQQHVIALKTDGTLWSWGDGGSGRTGQGNTTSLSSPVQIGSLTTWQRPVAKNTNSMATRTDGTLWVWGSGTQGQNGTGNTTAYSSPVQVGTQTIWKQSDINGGSGGSSYSWGGWIK